MTSTPPWLEKARRGWQHTGRQRPPFAVEPRPGQESVWDYPRPPCLFPVSGEVIVRAGAVELARSRRSVRVLETSHPPTFYLPPEDVRHDLLDIASGASLCEWKGRATYFDVVTSDRRLERAAWSYLDPTDEFLLITDYFSFYPAQLACFVDGHRVQPQPGGFYGGWVTPDVVGPFKGEPETSSW